MKIAIVAFDGFNEIDTFLTYTMLNRIPEWEVLICGNTTEIVSMNGCRIQAQCSLPYANEADVVLFSSSTQMIDLVEDPDIVEQFTLSQHDQLIGSQCSGVLFLVKLGLVSDQAVSCDRPTMKVLEYLNVPYIEDEPLSAWGNVATCGGSIGGHYLATWVIWRTLGIERAGNILQSVAPIGEQHNYVSRTIELFAQALVGDKFLDNVDIQTGVH